MANTTEKKGKPRMFIARARFGFLSAYEQGRAVHGPAHPAEEKVKQPGESNADFDARMWPYKAHTNEKGQVIIPAPSLKNMIDGAAAYLSMKVEGGRKGYKGVFKPGVLVIAPAILMKPGDGAKVKDEPYTRENMQKATYLLGTTKKDWFSYPQFWPAYADVEFHIIDKCITEGAFLKHLEGAGLFVGLGRWRVGRGGPNGRFTVSNFQWEPVFE
jgi:hypothetical protein